MAFREIDMSTFPRKAHFDYFRSMTNPYVGVTVQVDVTELVTFCKREKVSFYLTMIHLAALAADGVPEFRQRIRGDGIVEYDACPTSHTELLDDGTYCYCALRHELPFKEYLAYAETERQKCRENPSIEEEEDVESEYFVSTLPWLHYTAFVQPTTASGDSNPRITWGRYEENERGRKLLPVTVLVHHALVDGLQMSQFYDNLNKEIKRLTGNVTL